MPNPFNQVQQYNPNLQQLYRMLTHSNNPMEIFENLAKQNPNMKAISQALKAGQNPQQLFYSLCQQRNVDPQQFLKSITG